MGLAVSGPSSRWCEQFPNLVRALCISPMSSPAHMPEPCSAYAKARSGLDSALMSIRIVRLGTPRLPHEGIRDRHGARAAARGAPRQRYAADNWFDVWYPELAPSGALVTKAQSASSQENGTHS